jgi:flagellar hook-associated protein 2
LAPTGLKQTQPGANAKANINKLDIEWASNTLTNVMDGLTIQLNKTTAADASVQVMVAPDNNAVTTAINAFATAYNSAMSYLRDQTKYNADSKSAGPLQGDRTAINLMSQLRALAGSSSTASSAFGRLTDIGLEPQTDGTLKVNASKVTSATANMPELKKFFSAVNTDNKENSGIGQKFKSLTDGILASDGAISSRQDSLNNEIKENNDRQDQLTTRSKAYEARLRAQYQALDTQMAGLTSLSNYVSAQLAVLGSGG